jgi:hypothetical protein
MYEECSHQTNHESLVRHSVSRFLVQGLRSNNGRAKNDFYIDLVMSVDGLLTLVKSVYGILKRHRKLDESYRNLGWRLHFHGGVYTLADPEIHSFHLLKYAIRKGQSGWFEGSNATFRFSVVAIHPGEIGEGQIANFPKIEVAPVCPRTPSPTLIMKKFTSLMKDDWLSDDRKADALRYSKRFRDFMSGANVWSQDASGDYFRDRPKPPKWTEKEERALLCLIQSGFKFQESWQKILQHAFVTRSEVGTAQQWYKIRKRECKFTNCSNELTDPTRQNYMIVEAKSICTEILEEHLSCGVPELGEHPLKRKEAVLAERQESSSPTSSLLAKRRKVSFSPVSACEPGLDDGDVVTNCS